MVDCSECDGECCKRLAIDIDTPETMEDFDDIKWYLYHRGISVYQDREGDWCIQFDTKCKHLDSEGKCKIYPDRPPVCRDYSTEDCKMDNEDNCLVVFEKSEDVEEYVEKLKKEGKIKK